MLYEILSKVMANRLKTILPWIISETQCAFVKDKLILDNVLIAYELVHALKNRR